MRIDPFRPWLSALLLAAISAWAPAALAQEKEKPKEPPKDDLTPAQYRLGADAYLREYVAKRPEVDDAARVEQLMGMIRLLNDVASFESFERLYYVKDGFPNAMAMPPGFIVVHTGLFDEASAFAGKKYADSAEAGRRATAIVTATIAHEMAHLVLGHGVAKSTSRLDGGPLLQFTRDQERAADATAAFYLVNSFERLDEPLRGLYDMLEMFVGVEKRLKDAGIDVDKNRTHDAPADRKVEVEKYAAKLLESQDIYAHGAALVNQATDRATLDQAKLYFRAVKDSFPVLSGHLDHAIATASFKAWFLSAGPETIEVQPSMAFYGLDFSRVVREAGDPELLARARADLQRVTDAHPWSFLSRSQLAVLDSFAGEPEAARRNADLATKEAPDDPFVWNNLGVVALRSGDLEKAATAFGRARAVARSRGMADLASSLYNLAWVRAKGGQHAEASALVKEYAKYDPASPWMERLRAAVQPSAEEGEEKDPIEALTIQLLEEVKGIKIGVSGQKVVEALGDPDGSEDIGGMHRVDFSKAGLSVGISKDRSLVEWIIVGPGFDGPVGKIRPGMREADVRKALGEPADGLGGGWESYVSRHGFNVHYVADPEDPSRRVVDRIWVQKP